MKSYPATSDVVACTLPLDQLRQARRAWQELLGTALVSRDEVPGGLRLKVQPSRAGALERLVDIERGCCSWITFELDGPVLTMTADGEAEAAIRSMWMG